ncbi:MAG: DNA cytosine methyltransferase [Acidobacteriota bacterium]
MVAFDRTQASVSGDIAGPLRACGAQAEGVNDGKADVQCIGFKWHASNTARSMGEIKEGTPPITDKQPGVVGSFGVRRLTPIECERLQGLPDGHTDGQSDTQRYRQLGNAVAEPCGEWIGYRIVGVEAGR